MFWVLQNQFFHRNNLVGGMYRFAVIFLLLLVISSDGYKFRPTLSRRGSDKSLAEDLALVYINNSIPGYIIGPTASNSDCYHCVNQWLADPISPLQNESIQVYCSFFFPLNFKIWTAFLTKFDILIRDVNTTQWTRYEYFILLTR